MKLMMPFLFAVAFSWEASAIVLGQDRGGGHEVGLAFDACLRSVLNDLQENYPDLYAKADGPGLREIYNSPSTKIVVTDDPLPEEIDGIDQLGAAHFDRVGEDKVIKVQSARFPAIQDIRLRRSVCLHEILGLHQREETGRYPFSGDYLERVSFGSGLKSTVSASSRARNRNFIQPCHSDILTYTYDEWAWGMEVTNTPIPRICNTSGVYAPVPDSGRFTFLIGPLQGVVAQWNYSSYGPLYTVFDFSGSRLSFRDIVELKRNTRNLKEEIQATSVELASILDLSAMTFRLGARQAQPVFEALPNSCELGVIRDLDPSQKNGSLSIETGDWPWERTHADLFGLTLNEDETGALSIAFQTTLHYVSQRRVGETTTSNFWSGRGNVDLNSKGELVTFEADVWQKRFVSRAIGVVLSSDDSALKVWWPTSTIFKCGI